ncbi:hypothetical protein FQA39_LY08580 [Lamprigera yunnana]|nr:hypothetical protein FQA39_LY08580 [Lamprigera yunnana]
MWMLYAQEHWTKCYDLKSAVERLYEELGALEFDADHEAIYGMERYYTVQQCEELRDKYKIGRKDSLNHSLKLNTIFSSNFCRELSDRFSKGIEILDSIPTSCVQLAKEQIIKYSDPKYNINALKTGDCETMLLNQTIYYLNKSKSKWISVGLYYPFEFASVVKIFGRSKQYVIFKEEEWIQFHEQRENINKYLNGNICLKCLQIQLFSNNLEEYF